MTNSASGLARLVLVALAGFVVVQACSATVAEPDNSPGSGGSGGSSGAGGAKVFAPDVSSPVEGGAHGLNPLCGISVDACTPDDALACSDYVPLTPQRVELLALAGAGGGAGAGGSGGLGGAGGGAGEQGAGGGDGGQGASAGAGAGGDFGIGGVDGPGAEAGAGGVPGPPAYACRVVRTRSGATSSCAATGRGSANAPCFTGADCGAGLGCVTDGTVARCRPYCCSGDEACASGSYCAERSLQDESVPATATAPRVPACVPADNCQLSAPFPCVGEQCQCAEGLACMVVRPDGTTACITPGQGELGQACPCAPGFVCSRGTATATCVKLCSTSSERDAGASCATGKCQGSAELPAGWGVCVGG